MGSLYTTQAARRILPCGAERRAKPRYASGSQVMLRVPDPVRNGSLVGAGYARNLSVGGACLYTRHRLVPGQTVQVSIPMEYEELETSLPPHFDGVATVLRAHRIDARFMAIALRFDNALSDDMAYASYIALLCHTG